MRPHQPIHFQLQPFVLISGFELLLCEPLECINHVSHDSTRHFLLGELPLKALQTNLRVLVSTSAGWTKYHHRALF